MSLSGQRAAYLHRRKLMKSRAYWIVCLVCIVGLGIASRVVHTGWILLDKYAGDALYAAMVYGLISLVWQTSRLRKAVLAMLIMTALEVFQLTMIPAHMLPAELWRSASFPDC